MGQRLIRPIVEPILFDEKDNPLNRISKETAKDYSLTSQELAMVSGLKRHRYNYIKQNMELASKFQQFKDLQQGFKKTILSKNNEQNLKLLMKKNERKE